MKLEQGSIFVTAYESKFDPLTRYSTQRVTTKEERILWFIQGYDYKLQVLSVHMTSARRSFNEVTDYVMKVVRVKRDVKVRCRLRQPRIVEILSSHMLEDLVYLHSRPRQRSTTCLPLPVTIRELLLITF